MGPSSTQRYKLWAAGQVTARDSLCTSTALIPLRACLQGGVCVAGGREEGAGGGGKCQKLWVGHEEKAQVNLLQCKSKKGPLEAQVTCGYRAFLFLTAGVGGCGSKALTSSRLSRDSGRWPNFVTAVASAEGNPWRLWDTEIRPSRFPAGQSPALSPNSPWAIHRLLRLFFSCGGGSLSSTIIPTTNYSGAKEKLLSI